jgi:uncharacterized membrane protein YtjA (UPF0391 family)
MLPSRRYATGNFKATYRLRGMAGEKSLELLFRVYRVAFLVQMFREVSSGGFEMLYYALLFLVVALIAGFLGFGGIAFAAAGIAKILFFVFLVIFIVTLIMHLTRGGTARGL